MQPQMTNELSSLFTLILGALAILVVVIVVVITLVVYCKICAKAGYNWAWGLLMFVPIAGLILLFYFAFAEWPIQRELRQLKQRCGGMPT